MKLQSLLMDAPAGVVFTLLNSCSILLVGILSVAVWREKINAAAILMILSALGAIVLGSI